MERDFSGIWESLQRFVFDMQAELNANAAKGEDFSWKQCDPGDLLDSLRYDVVQLRNMIVHPELYKSGLTALEKEKASYSAGGKVSYFTVREKCADIANMAMIVSDAYYGHPLEAALEARIAELEAENAGLRKRIENALLFYDWDEGVILSESDQAAVIGGVLLALYGDGVAVEEAADGGEEE